MLATAVLNFYVVKSQQADRGVSVCTVEFRCYHLVIPGRDNDLLPRDRHSF